MINFPIFIEYQIESNILTKYKYIYILKKIVLNYINKNKYSFAKNKEILNKLNILSNHTVKKNPLLFIGTLDNPCSEDLSYDKENDIMGGSIININNINNINNNIINNNNYYILQFIQCIILFFDNEYINYENQNIGVKIFLCILIFMLLLVIIFIDINII